MQGPITFELVLFLVVVGGAVAGSWWFLFSSILAVRRDLHDLRLEVARDYASQQLLRDVEKRVVGELKELRKEFHDLPERISAVLTAANRK